jgi:curli biogenesis system outer membrane secretion channel CsgG
MNGCIRHGLMLGLAAAVLSGCAAPGYRRPPARSQVASGPAVIRPVVAVTQFENRANFRGQWDLGGGMAEMLVERLMASERVIVLEREHLDGVLSEIVRQGRDLFRSEGRVERGRLRNARYLIRGVVTDFTVTSDASGWFETANVSAATRGSRTRVGLYVTVSDVESGQIVSAVRTEGAAAAGGFRGGVNYANVSFGGDAYFRTPLGRATQAAMGRAVDALLEDIPVEYWEPRVAEGGPGTVVVNGGEDVGLRVGQRFQVREQGRQITDPITGEVIERLPGRVLGTVEIHTVLARSSHALLLDGEASRGDYLEPVW